MRYMLDTNMVSDLVRDPLGRVAQQMHLVSEDNVCTSIIVAAESRFGAARKESRRLNEALEGVLERLSILPFEEPAERRYASLRLHLERVGEPIGGNDMLIAAHALALDCVLVTDNEREFRRIPGLVVENWLRPA